jgi:hypothetical protein
LFGAQVRRDYHLLIVIVQGVERVEEGLLGLVFALQELNIVYQKNVYVTVCGLKLSIFIGLDGINKVVCEFFARNISDLGPRF